MSSDSPRPTIRLTLACDNACVFCAQDGLDDAARDRAVVSAALRGLRDGGHEAVTFVGGEPVLFAGLEATVAEAAALGFGEIGLQTNGFLIGEDRQRLEALARAGLTDVHFSLHGASADVHDHHTGRPGSFDRAVRAVKAARRETLQSVVTTVLTRSNQAVLGELPRLLSALGVAAWHIAVPIARGRAEDAADSLLPRLALALPYALHALSRAESSGLAVFVSGAPLCLLGPFADRSLPTIGRAYAEVCQGCEARSRCPGVDALYLSRFGGDELHVCAAPEPPKAAHLAQHFVGTGALAPRRPKTVSKTPLAVVD